MTLLKKQRVCILVVCVLAASCISLYAQGGHMVHLGDARVDGARDRDSITVGRSTERSGRSSCGFTGGAVNFDRVIVRYGNGTQEELQIRNRIESGGRTRIIDLPGDRRIIQSVELWYGKDTWRTRPKVSLYGVR